MYPKKKKIPVKGEPQAKELKPCSSCGKPKPLANKSRRLCGLCLAKENKEKQRLKRGKKRKIRQETITQDKLDQITSWLVRTIYPQVCPHCKIDLVYKTSNCGHFVSRTKQSTRYSLRNLGAIDRNCNFYVPEHVWSLGKFLDTVWGEGNADNQIIISKKHVKFTKEDRREIYDVYKAALERAEKCRTQEEKYELLKETQLLYEQIVKPLIK
jgi:hypothetical protein